MEAMLVKFGKPIRIMDEHDSGDEGSVISDGLYRIFRWISRSPATCAKNTLIASGSEIEPPRSQGTRVRAAHLPLWALLALIAVPFRPALPADLESTLDEVVVTAQKRVENAQTVPLSIAAYSDADLKRQGITDIQGLARLTPNLNIDSTSPFSGTSTMLSASIRGIGQDDFAFNLDPGVGVYVDGVYLARSVGANQNLLDVDHVEILKGPQGTLFGRNTIGGAISIVTRTPGDVYAVQAQATAGSDQRHDIALSADMPILPKLLSTLSFSSEQREGYENRIAYPTTTPYVSDPAGAFHNAGTEAFGTQGGQDQQIVRGKLLWKASDTVTATATADWTHVNESSPALTTLTVYSAAQGGVFNTIYNACINGMQFIPTAQLICGPRGVIGTSLWNANASLTSQRLPFDASTAITHSRDATYATGPNFDKLDSYGNSLTLDWRVNRSLAVRSITGWRELQWKSGSDLAGSSTDVEDLSFAEGQRQFSEEVELIGDAFDSQLHYVVGAYDFSESGFIHDTVEIGDGLLQIDGPNSLWTSSYAGFLHIDYQVTDALGVTLGGRYSEDHKRFIGSQQELNDFFYKISGCYPPNASASLIGAPANLTCRQVLGFTNPDNPEQVYPAGLNHEQFGVFTPAAGLQYHLGDDLLAYFNYSKGFKSGGWTTRLTSPLPPGSSAPTFSPETDNAYEWGIKSESLNNTLVVNGAVFYSRYRDIQLTYQVSTSPVTENAGDADIKGAELELRSILTSHFALNANLGFIDAYYTSILPGARASTGSELPKTPKWKAVFGPEWHTIVLDKMLRCNLDYTHTGSMYNDVENSSVIARHATNLLNAKISLASVDDRVSLTIGGTNLSNDRFLTTGNVNVAGGFASGYYSAPREWFATVTSKF